MWDYIKKKSKFTVLAVPKISPYLISKEEFERIEREAQPSKKILEESRKRFNNYENIHFENDCGIKSFNDYINKEDDNRCR